jgi:hypothetical protein
VPTCCANRPEMLRVCGSPMYNGLYRGKPCDRVSRPLAPMRLPAHSANLKCFNEYLPSAPDSREWGDLEKCQGCTTPRQRSYAMKSAAFCPFFLPPLLTPCEKLRLATCVANLRDLDCRSPLGWDCLSCCTRVQSAIPCLRTGCGALSAFVNVARIRSDAFWFSAVR